MFKLFNDIIELNENKICIFEIGAFYVVVGEQAVYLSSRLGLKKVCFAPCICKVGFPKTSLDKYIKLLEMLGISFVVYNSCNVATEAEVMYKLKGYKKSIEYICSGFVLDTSFSCDCNHCTFKKSEIMQELDKCRRQIAILAEKISRLEIMKVESQEDNCNNPFNINTIQDYEELTIWGEDNAK